MGTEVKGMISRYIEAILIARHCLEKKSVSGIWLFGGVARTGDSHHDIDLILGVSDGNFERFMEEFASREPGFVRTGMYGEGSRRQTVPEVRFDIAQSIVGTIRPKIWTDKAVYSAGGPDYEIVAADITVDVFLLPMDWQARTEELDQEYRSKDGALFERILQTAFPFDPAQDRYVSKDGVPLIFKIAEGVYA